MRNDTFETSKLKNISDHDLQATISSNEGARSRLLMAPTTQDLRKRLRLWFDNTQADFKKLTLTSDLESRLEEPETLLGMLLSMPDMANRVEAAVLSQVGKGLITLEEQQSRIAAMAAESEACVAELRDRRESGVTTVIAISEAVATCKLELCKNGAIFVEVNGSRKQLDRAWFTGRGKRWSAKAEVIDGQSPTGSKLNNWVPRSASWQLTQSQAGEAHSMLSIQANRSGAGAGTAIGTFRLVSRVPEKVDAT